MTRSTGETEEVFGPEDFGIGRLFFHVSDAIIVASARTERIVLWNRAAERLFGYSQAEALELPLHALVPQPLRNLHRAGIARYQATGTGQLLDRGSAVELTALRKDRREVPIELTLTAIPERSPTGDRFALALIRDVSERKAAETAARAVFEASSDRRRAFELNDTIVQGLASAKLAFEADEHEMGISLLDETLKKAQALVTRLFSQIEAAEGRIGPGDLVRSGDEPQPDDPSPSAASPEPPS